MKFLFQKEANEASEKVILKINLRKKNIRNNINV